MPKTRSRLEERLAQLLAITPPLSARRTAEPIRIDLVYLNEEDQGQLNSRLRE